MFAVNSPVQPKSPIAKGFTIRADPLRSPGFGEQINEKRVHAHIAEEPGPTLDSLHINQPIRKSQSKQTPTATDNDKGTGADALDDRRHRIESIADCDSDQILQSPGT